jgi:hypothetical protein
VAQPAAADPLPAASVPVPKPGAGEALDKVAWHSVGSLLKALQIVFNKLSESRALEISSPLIIKVGEPPTLYFALSAL